MDSLQHRTDDSTIDALLEGGPADIPAPMRRCRARLDDEKIKLPWGSGYEHFVRRPEDDDVPLTVFYWVGRTKIAE
jgi:hypothetical protein